MIATLAGDHDRERIALFDATSDLGVPTALAVLPAPAGSGRPPAVGAGCCELASRAARHGPVRPRPRRTVRERVHIGYGILSAACTLAMLALVVLEVEQSIGVLG